jgi:hypothetical protein
LKPAAGTPSSTPSEPNPHPVNNKETESPARAKSEKDRILLPHAPQIEPSIRPFFTTFRWYQTVLYRNKYNSTAIAIQPTIKRVAAFILLW